MKTSTRLAAPAQDLKTFSSVGLEMAIENTERRIAKGQGDRALALEYLRQLQAELATR